jgi:uncharacterized membrane protein
MNRMNGTQVGVIAVVVLLVFLIGSSLLGGYGSGMMGPGMMGGWGLGLFGGLGMIIMWIVPLSFLALLVVGIVWLVRVAAGSPPTGSQTLSETSTCPNCNRSIQDDWQLCPYCGQKLE